MPGISQNTRFGGRPRIALLIETSRAYGRDLLKGIANYSREYGPWCLDIEERMISDDEPNWLGNWQGDGIIARVESRKLETALKKTGVPVVDVSGLHHVSMPVIDTDNRAVAMMAASHLIEKGFLSFAFCGYGGLNYSSLRRDAYREFMDSHNLPLSIYEPPALEGARLGEVEQQGLYLEEPLAEWLEALPKPVGVMACNDIRGQQVVKACRERGIPMPEAVGLIGVDDDEILCELSNPTLSSVIPDATRIGYEACTLLDQMMRSGLRSTERMLIPPKGIAMRQSTASQAIGDPTIAEALCLIRRRASENLSVDEVASSVSLARRTFERRFIHFVGRSPHAEIQRMRIERVAELLRTTECNLATVAERAGFAYAEYMCTLFKQKTGETPGRYRRRHRTNEPSPSDI